MSSNQIEVILAEDCLDDEAVDESKCERIENLISTLGWSAVLACLIEILSVNRRIKDYQVVAQVLWGAVLDKREMLSDRVVALLYHRFNPPGNDEDNLVWSITSKLKGVGYLSDYDPLSDPGVARAMAKLGAD